MQIENHSITFNIASAFSRKRTSRREICLQVAATMRATIKSIQNCEICRIRCPRIHVRPPDPSHSFNRKSFYFSFLVKDVFFGKRLSIKRGKWKTSSLQHWRKNPLLDYHVVSRCLRKHIQNLALTIIHLQKDI